MGVCVKGGQAGKPQEAQAWPHGLALQLPRVRQPAGHTASLLWGDLPRKLLLSGGDLVSNSWGLPFLFPSLRLSRVQDKALSGCLLQKKPGDASGQLMACQPVQAPSHTVIHTALRRLCQQAWPNWAQLLSLHLKRVQG